MIMGVFIYAGSSDNNLPTVHDVPTIFITARSEAIAYFLLLTNL